MRRAHHVRPARADDWPGIANCFGQAAVAAWGSFLPRETIRALSAPDRWQTAVYKGSVLNPVFVVETEGQVIGFSILRSSEDEGALPLTGELDAFYTHPHFWGQGAGTALMAETVSKAKELKFKRLTLWTEERNERARRFYFLDGWRESGEVR
ncbi:MAG: N-acetyltransferase family protein, partial [Fimbriimonas sp.]